MYKNMKLSSTVRNVLIEITMKHTGDTEKRIHFFLSLCSFKTCILAMNMWCTRLWGYSSEKN